MTPITGTISDDSIARIPGLLEYISKLSGEVRNVIPSIVEDSDGNVSVVPDALFEAARFVAEYNNGNTTQSAYPKAAYLYNLLENNPESKFKLDRFLKYLRGESGESVNEVRAQIPEFDEAFPMDNMSPGQMREFAMTLIEWYLNRKMANGYSPLSPHSYLNTMLTNLIGNSLFSTTLIDKAKEDM